MPPEFNWNTHRLQRLRSAVRAYNRAITMRTRELSELPNGERLIPNLPKRVTVEEIQGRISNVNDFRRIAGYSNDLARGRSSVLTRILKSYNPNALEFVDGSGYFTEYEVGEYNLDMRALIRHAKRRRRNMQRDLFDGDNLTKDFNEMTPTELNNASNNNDLNVQFTSEPDESVEDIDEETKERWRHEDAQKKRDGLEHDKELENYYNVWTDHANHHHLLPDYELMVRALEFLRNERPDAGLKLFDSGADEVDIWFIIDSEQRNAYRNIPFEERHNRAVKFVVGWAHMAGFGGEVL